MHMRRIASQLADLFARHGLAAQADGTVTGRTRTSYRVPLVVQTEAGRVLVDGDLEGPAVDDGAVLRLYLTAVDCGARALYLHCGDANSDARDAGGDRVTLWARDEAVGLLGETLWNSALGLPLPPLPGPLATATVAAAPPATATQPLVTAVMRPKVHSAAAAEALPAGPVLEPFIDLDTPQAPAVDLETGVDVVVTSLPTSPADELVHAEPTPPSAPTVAPHVAGDEASPEAQPEAQSPARAESVLFEMPPAFRPEAPSDAPLPVPDGSRGLLPARITLDDARRAVSDRLFGIEEWELILQPVHLFDYAVEVLRAGSLEADTQRGRVQVNGTDRRVTTTDAAASDPPARVFAASDLTVMDKVLRVSPERADQLAREWATATHGKTVDVPSSDADDSFDLTERRVIGPTSGQVTLQPLGVWHRPFWRLWGNNGHVDLDAVEGMVLDEEIKSPNPDFLMVE